MGYLLLIAGIALMDQLVKLLVMNHMVLNESIEIWNFIQLTYVQNTGAAFSLFRNGTLILGAVAAIYLLVIAVLWRKPFVRPYHLPLALLAGGALGNLIDRVFRGYVVDYIQVGSWPVFNIADIMVVIGVSLMTLLVLRSEVGNDGKDKNSAS